MKEREVSKSMQVARAIHFNFFHDEPQPDRKRVTFIADCWESPEGPRRDIGRDSTARASLPAELTSGIYPPAAGVD